MSVYSPEQLLTLAKQQKAARPQSVGLDPAAELAEYIDDVTSGRVYAVPMPWPTLDALTNALMPGALVVVCGDPGAGKTYFLLDCLRHWTRNDVDASVYFLEEDRKFYLRRILAQEEGRSEFTKIAWWKANPEIVREAAERHKQTVRELGGRITVATSLKQLELRTLSSWLEEELKSGRRVCVIDPITAAYAGADRWLADDEFVMRTKSLVTRYAASLIIVTHPRKGNVPHKTGHDMANGAAYYRFSSAALWINRTKRAKRYEVATPHGPTTVDTDLTIQIHKAREGKGERQELAFCFGDGLHFTEGGIITGESDGEVPAGDVVEQPMSDEELRRAMQHLAKSFPLKINTTQADTIRPEVARRSYSVAIDVIDDHLKTTGATPDIPKLIEQLRSHP